MSANKSKNKNSKRNNAKKSVITANPKSQQQAHVKSTPQSFSWPPEDNQVPSHTERRTSQEENNAETLEQRQNTTQSPNQVLSIEQGVQPSTSEIANPISLGVDESVTSENVKSHNVANAEALSQESEKAGNANKKDVQEKELNENPSNTISLDNKSDQFKAIIEFALQFEKLEEEQTKLKRKIKKLNDKYRTLEEDHKKLSEDYKKLTETCKELSVSLNESKGLCAERLKEINQLKSEVAHRNEVIDIVRADRTESAQEYKNSLGAALKTFYSDYIQLKELPMTAEIGAAMAQTLDQVFSKLNANGIVIE